MLDLLIWLLNVQVVLGSQYFVDISLCEWGLTAKGTKGLRREREACHMKTLHF